MKRLTSWLLALAIALSSIVAPAQLALTGAGKNPAGGGGCSPAIVQQRYVTSTNGNGTTHDLPYVSTVTSGNAMLAVLFGASDVADITGVTANGISGTPALTQDYTNAFAVRTARVYRLSNAGSGGTGVRATMSAAHLDLAGWIIEVSCMTNTTPFTASGTFPDDFGPTELDATASVNASGDIAFARFSDVPLANITATRSGFTQSGESNGTELLQTNMNSGPTSVTAGATISSNGFSTAGFVVTYKKGP